MNTDYLLGWPLTPAAGMHLLANREIVEDHWNVEWHVGRPELLTEPLVLPLSPWEDVQGPAKCLRDPVTGLFRMWYKVCNITSYRYFFNHGSDPGPLPGAYCVGYAESEDGLHWHRLRHEPFLAQGFSGQAFDARSVIVSSAWLPMDKRRLLLFYAGGDLVPQCRRRRRRGAGRNR